MAARQQPKPAKRKPPSGSLVIWRGGIAYENFTVHGRRFRECLGTSDRTEAEALAARRKSDALLGVAVGSREGRGPRRGEAQITLDEALARYCVEVGQYAATADDIRRYGQVLIAGLGGTTPLGALDFSALSHYVARRRVRQIKTGGKIELRDRANASVNRELGHLRTVMLAAVRWGHKVAAIEWRRLMLDEPENVQLVLSEAAEERFFAALRPDYHAMAEFALTSGVRLNNVIGVRWEQIDEAAGTITFRTKSRKPGGKLLVLPLTRALAAIVGPERGRHPEFVFTYVCAKNRHEPHKGVVQVKGLRYPFSHDGWRREWDRARIAAGVPALRFHDLRHTAATRALQAHKNLRTVQKLLGHATITTTLRYVASDVDDLRAAMEAVDNARQATRHKTRHRLVSGGENS